MSSKVELSLDQIITIRINRQEMSIKSLLNLHSEKEAIEAKKFSRLRDAELLMVNNSISYHNNLLFGKMS